MISALVTTQLEKYPQMKAQDIIKLIYQNEFGGGHMIDDPETSLKRLKDEAKQLKNNSFIEEDIGNDLVRVYLGNAGELELLTLNQLFVYSAKLMNGSIISFINKLEQLKSACQRGTISFDYRQICLEIENYEKLNYPPISHSSTYRELYQPHYRFINKQIYSYFPVILKINQLLQTTDRLNIAIDGKCGAGTSTLGEMIKAIFETNLFKMDDFFLQPFQRTAARLNEPGGNIDYERFKETVIVPLQHQESVKYQRFDCSKMALEAHVELIPYSRFNVIEGTYSMHPYFGMFYDFTIALNVSDDIQAKRILMRNGEMMYEKFKKIWIPLENKYFDQYNIFNVADLQYYSN